MKNNDMRNEIEELQAQVATLTADRKAREKEQANAQPEQSTQSEAASTEEHVETAEAETTDISSMFQELVETVDQEIKEASPVTVLVVFALGVLMGRLLPR